MKHVLRLFILFWTVLPAWADTAPALAPAAPNIAAKSYFLQDFHSGSVLAEKNSDARVEPASLTKLMTAYVVFTELRAGRATLQDRARISRTAWRTGGSRMFVPVDTEVGLEELLKGMIIQSGNDASVAIAEHFGGSESGFATIMNEHARNLGMYGTHFVNATGLPHPDHYSTARDMAVLAASLIREFPEYYTWYSEKSYTYNKITQHNRNRLLWQDPSVDGMKTGHTDAAGYCLVASAVRNDMRLVMVVMGTNSDDARAQESAKLLSHGFRSYETKRLFGANEPLKTHRVWKGRDEELALGLTEPLYVTVPRGQYERLNASLAVDRRIEAPTKQGQRLGTVNLRLGDTLLAERPLVALEEMPEGNLWRQVVDGVKMMFD